MKVKFLTLAAMAAVLLNSCSEDVVTSESVQTPVGFRIAGTRAKLYSTADLPPFMLVDAYLTTSGAKYFGQERFEKLTTATDGIPENNYLSGNRYYWPAGDNNGLSFFAVGGIPEESDGEPDGNISSITSNIDTKTLTVSNLVLSLNESTYYRKELLGAYCEGTKVQNANGGVPLKFHHLLSQIEFKAKSSNPSYNFTVSCAKIGWISNKGTLNAIWSASNATPTCNWTVSTAKNDKFDVGILEGNYTLSENVISLSAGLTDGIVSIPQTFSAWANTGTNKVPIATNDALATPGSYLVMNVFITTKAGAPFYQGFCYIPLSGTWEAGKKYTYILDFTNGAGYDDQGEPIFGKPINFTCEVSDWGVEADENKGMNVN